MTANKRKAILKALASDANMLFQKQIVKTPSVKEYLKGRNITSEEINTYALGYAYSGYKNDLLAMGYDESQLMNLGIINYDGKEVLKGRITFPIFNKSGDPIAFSGRKMEEDTFGPKYLNTIESPIFKKRQTLWNLNNVVRSKEIIVVEGFMDVIAYSRIGKSAVALMGTALSNQHIKYLEDKEVILSLDGDEAGLRASDKALINFLKNGKRVQVISMLNDIDPFEVVNQNPDSLQELYISKKDIEDYITMDIDKFDSNSFKDIMAFLDLIEPFIRDSNNLLDTDRVFKKVREAFGIEISSIKSHFKEKGIENFEEWNPISNTR